MAAGPGAQVSSSRGLGLVLKSQSLDSLTETVVIQQQTRCLALESWGKLVRSQMQLEEFNLEEFPFYFSKGLKLSPWFYV